MSIIGFMPTQVRKQRGYLEGYGSVLNIFPVKRREQGVRHQFYRGGQTINEAFAADWKAIVGDLKKASRKALIGHKAPER